MMKKVTIALIGAGARGFTYGRYAVQNPGEVQFVAVAEPDRERRERFGREHHISEEMLFETWEDLLKVPKIADAIAICTQDQMHMEPALEALKQGYHILMEKPMAPTPQECLMIGEYAKDYRKVFTICHVLRYTEFFSTIKQLLNEGKIGKLMTISHTENVGYFHQAHSYVRGNWRNSKASSPMILAKSCHDMDILLWLADAKCVNLSSFGYLTHFKSENAPQGAPKRCTDGCPVEKECPYSAKKIYLGDNIGWPTDVITTDLSVEGRLKALQEGPYGRCVYYCDNDVVDHQVVNMEFANEVTAAFTMSAFNKGGRTIKLMGTHGELRGFMEKGDIEIFEFASGKTTTISIPANGSGHGGGDTGIMRSFIKEVQASENGHSEGLTSATISVQSHLMAFAAEEARVNKQVVNIEQYTHQLGQR